MTIGTGLLIMFAVILTLKYINLRSKIKTMKETDDRQKKDLESYLGFLMQYREILNRNNIDINNTITVHDTPKTKYTIDSVLDEIAEKGIDNVSEDKLNFLRNKQDGKDS